MNKMLEALADLLGVGTKTLEQVVDTTGLVLPDLVEKAMRELPLFRLFNNIEILSVIVFVLFLILTAVVTLFNAFELHFENKSVNKLNKIFLSVTVFFVFVTLGIAVLKATLTPTIYSIEYVVETIKQD